jgi:thioredoxin-dependent peroxiredoxin
LIREGDVAPDFSLLSQGGETVALHEFRGAKHVVLYFYPRDFTMGCTAEAKAFSESYQELVGKGAEVIGVSSDSTERHREFADECGVSFRLLSDPGGKVRAAYGATGALGLIPGRVTFVIDRAGVVRKVFSSQTQPRRHVAEALAALDGIESVK